MKMFASREKYAPIKPILEKLRADFSEVQGKPFTNFYCPILFKDEDVELCRAHIVNEVFPDSSQAWTVQRKDVDNFYGSRFEADFTSIRYAQEDLAKKVLVDKNLYRQFSPKMVIDNEPYDFFIANDIVPEHFTSLVFENERDSVQIGLKMPPEDFFEVVDQKWGIEASKDVRISALVSLIKAAHLTLFAILGYRYGLSLSGSFVGKDILGNFFSQNRTKSKSLVLEDAITYFHEYVHMVRPILPGNHGLKGTITDGVFHICRGNNNSIWAFIVYINTSHVLHAVMTPNFDQPENVERFINFLNNKNEIIEASLCHFNMDRWEIHKDVRQLIWPKTGVLYPMS